MSGVSSINQTLPQWDGGSRKIRFIYLVNVTSFRLTECPEKSPVAPLFLGADLLSNTVIRTENHPRYHAKFAKKGLATKIHFSSAFRFSELKVSAAHNSLWFYSVQGLFRLAFEMYSRQEQLAVLENFQDVWKSQINASPLEMSYSLTEQLDYAMSNSVCDILSQHCQVGQELVAACSTDTGDTSADHDYCFPQQGFQTEQRPLAVSKVRHILHSWDDKLSSGTQTLTEQQLGFVLLFLECVDDCIQGNLEEIDVTEMVLALLNAKQWGSAYSSTLHNCVGRWLGQQFHSANSSISQKVESFKFEHIERMSELPPAEELATELFPEAMLTLLLHWMGLSEESALEKRRSKYPILLLILEFANHNLITGVAHVLYSTLICR
ncbi:uncharacterized protein ACBR49_020152 [Aulostomus maculatus]